MQTLPELHNTVLTSEEYVDYKKGLGFYVFIRKNDIKIENILEDPQYTTLFNYMQNDDIEAFMSEYKDVESKSDIISTLIFDARNYKKFEILKFLIEDSGGLNYIWNLFLGVFRYDNKECENVVSRCDENTPISNFLLNEIDMTKPFHNDFEGESGNFYFNPDMFDTHDELFDELFESTMLNS